MSKSHCTHPHQPSPRRIRRPQPPSHTSPAEPSQHLTMRCPPGHRGPSAGFARTGLGRSAAADAGDSPSSALCSAPPPPSTAQRGLLREPVDGVAARSLGYAASSSRRASARTSAVHHASGTH